MKRKNANISILYIPTFVLVFIETLSFFENNFFIHSWK